MSRLQYISQGDTLYAQEKHIKTALDYGAKWIQIRWKQHKDGAFLAFCRSIKVCCEQYHARCIINDHVDAAIKIDADGIHLGLDDMPVADARRVLGDSAIIGGTANTLTDVIQRIEEGCDYIGLGPFRFTSTKQKLSPILGLVGYSEIMQSLNEQKHPPIYAIGGIQVDDIEALQNLGIYGVAVSSVIHEDPAIIQSIKSKWL